MRILAVTNLYPPYYRGGYEIRCAQLMESLQRAGHDVFVLTSVHGLPRAARRTEVRNGVRVERGLNEYVFTPPRTYRPWVLSRARQELADASHFAEILSRFRPDVVSWWGMNGLSKLLLALPRARGIPDVCWIEHWWMIAEYGPGGRVASDFWMKLWNGRWGPRGLRPIFGWLGRRWERRVARRGIPTRGFDSPGHVVFVSEYMRTLHREAGFEFASSDVVYGGVPAEPFHEPVRRDAGSDQPLRLLYAGQLSPDRGLHTVIEAIGAMPPSAAPRLTLTVAGDGSPSYLSEARARVERLGLSDRVRFLGRVPHEEMPQVYRTHDVLVFPSTRAEGLPLTMVEAMLAGCAVLTTGSGGAMEIARLADLPLFRGGDHASLACQLLSLLDDREQVSRIASRGQAIAVRDFSFDAMVERFTRTLRTVCGTSSDGLCGSMSAPHRDPGTRNNV